MSTMTTDMIPSRKAQPLAMLQARPMIRLIDDSPDNLLILGDILTENGYEVMFAESGLSGLERTRFMKPDLILMDARMPGINRLAACRAFKGKIDVHDIPVILMSSQRGGTLRQEVLDAGSLNYWEKPLSPNFHRETLKTLLPGPDSIQGERS